MGLQHKNESYHFHPLDTSGVSWDTSGVVITQFSQDHLGYAVFLPLWRAGTQGSEGWVTLKAANLQRAQLWTLTASQTKSSVTPRKMTSRKGPPDMKAASYSTEIEICKNFRNEEVENYLHFVQGNICTLLQQRWEDDKPSTHFRKFRQNCVSWLFPVWHRDRMAFVQRENPPVQNLPKNINFKGCSTYPSSRIPPTDPIKSQRA